MQLNEDKCQIIISSHRSEAIWANIVQEKKWESKNQKLLGVITDCQLSFRVKFWWVFSTAFYKNLEKS